MSDEEINEILANDGSGVIYFWMPEGSQVVPHFMIGVADGGGYSSVLMSKNCWEKMKAKVDELISKHVVSNSELHCKPPIEDYKHAHDGIEEDLT